MKILILSSNNGRGHNSAAMAISEYFQENNCQCIIKDSLGFVSKKLSNFVSVVHKAAFNGFSCIYDINYSKIEQRKKILGKGSLSRQIIDLGSNKLAEYILTNDIDYVISTHIFGAILVEDACDKWFFNVGHAFVCTDYACSPGIEELSNSTVFIPDDCMDKNFKYLLSSNCKVICSGIPVSKKFITNKKKSDQNFHTLVLLNTLNNKILKDLIQKMYHQKNENVFVRIICANKKIYKSLRKFKTEHFEILFDLGNMAEHLDWADVLISKPGGLSVTESISKKVPMLLYKIIKSNEEHNAQYVEMKNFGIGFDSYSELFIAWKQIVDNNSLLDKFNASLNLEKGNCACEFVYNTVIGEIKE